MKIRTVYFKVPDPRKAAAFWSELLQIKPHKEFDSWHEFQCGETRLGLLQSEEWFGGSGAVPVFEFSDDQIQSRIDCAKKLGAEIVFNGLDDPQVRSIVFKCPFGHEFELSKFHGA